MYQYFNPRTREGCDYVFRIISPFLYNFNPRTREGCDLQDYRAKLVITPISIHAPVKGATAFLVPADNNDRISIHAPVKGATFVYFYT